MSTNHNTVQHHWLLQQPPPKHACAAACTRMLRVGHRNLTPSSSGVAPLKSLQQRGSSTATGVRVMCTTQHNLEMLKGLAGHLSVLVLTCTHILLTSCMLRRCCTASWMTASTQPNPGCHSGLDTHTPHAIHGTHNS